MITSKWNRRAAAEVGAIGEQQLKQMQSGEAVEASEAAYLTLSSFLFH